MTTLPVLETFETNQGVSSNTLSCPKPTGVTTNDLLVLICCQEEEQMAGGGDIFTVTPTGWTKQNESGSPASDVHIAVFYKISDGTNEPDPQTVTTTGDAGQWNMYYLRISGADTTTPIPLDAFSESGTVLSVIPIPGVTTVIANSKVLYGLAFDGGDGTPFSVDNSFVERSETSQGGGGPGCSSCFGDKDLAVAGASGTATVTAFSADTSSFFQLSISPTPDVVGFPHSQGIIIG